MVDVSHDRHHGRAEPQRRLFFPLIVEVLGLEFGFLLLTRVNEPDGRVELGREQLDHLVRQGLRGRDHLALLEEKSHHVCAGPVELGTQLLGRRTPLDDDLALGNGCIRRGVMSDFLSFELFDRTSTASPGPSAGRTAPVSKGSSSAATRAARSSGTRSASGSAGEPSAGSSSPTSRPIRTGAGPRGGSGASRSETTAGTSRSAGTRASWTPGARRRALTRAAPRRRGYGLA